MNDEMNNYGINNPDGSSGKQYNEGKVSFHNDDPGYIKEDSLSGQPETPQFSETYDAPKNSSSSRQSSSSSQQSESSSSSDNLSSSTSSASSTASGAASGAASSAASSVASATSAIGSSIGALAGTVAATVTAAAVVVATFVSTLVINLLLVMAGMNSLVFQVEMRGAQEEDFQTPIIAILEGEGVHQEQEIRQDTVYLTFTDLEPGKEYTVWVKNEEKTFVKKSYITATEEPQQGSVEARVQEDEVIAAVDQINLKAGQFYTLSVKNAQGKTVFAKDDVEPSKEFRFAAPEAAGVYSVTVSIGGKACALSQFEIFDKSKPQPEPEPQPQPEPEPQPEPQPVAEYDFANGTWTWASDYLSASISFAEIHGGEPLVIEATISESYIEPTCETNGKTIYVATAVYNNREYSDERTVAQPAGHSYQWVAKSVDCIDEGMAGHYYCEVCGKYFDENKVEVSAEDLILPAVGVAGDPVKLTSNDLSADLVGRQVYLRSDGSNNDYYGVKIGASNNTTTDMNDLTAFTIESISDNDVLLVYDGKYLSVSNNATVNFNSTTPNVLTVSSYDGSISANSSYFICYDNWEEVIRMSNTAMNGYVYMYLIPTVDHSYGELIPEVSADCEHEGMAAHYHCEVCGKYFDEDYHQVNAEDLIIPVSEHEYRFSGFEWIETENNGYTATALFICAWNEEHTLEIPATVEQEDNYYRAYVEFNGEEYFDEIPTNGGSDEPESGTALNISEGVIRIYSDGYTRSNDENATLVPFENSADNPYVITGSLEADTPLLIDTRTKSGSSAGSKTYYLTFDNVEIKGDSGLWATAVVISPYDSVVIHIKNNGTSHVNPYGHVAFEIQNGDATVEIYIESDNEFDGFDFADGSGRYGLYNPSQNIRVYMNNVEVDEYGNPIS